MAIPQPQKINAIEFGDYTRVSWTGSAEAPVEGYKIYAGASITPDWINSIDNGLNDGDDGIGIKTFTVLINVPSQIICRGETFEEYPEGEQTSPMNAGGVKWDGSWGTTASTVGYVGYGDNFESYSEGEITEPMNGGSGWDGPWGTTASTIGYFGYGEDFSNYALGDASAQDFNSGIGWDGSAVFTPIEIGYIGYGEDFGSYALGDASGQDFNSGTGWDGSAVFHNVVA